MTLLALAFTVISGVALMALPRRWAPMPFIAGACYMTLGQGIEIGPFTFTVIRLLVLVGFVRVMLRREMLVGGLNRLDGVIVAWSTWAALSSLFHNQPAPALVYRLGMAYNACGIYFLLRIFCSSVDDVVRLCQTTALVLTLVALAMLNERATLHNVFSIFGGVPAVPEIRAGHVRAFGPFAHPILAGTVGAVSLPLMVASWRRNRTVSLLGILACLAIVVTSASSGPVMSAAFGVGALLLWRYRHSMRALRWGAIGLYAALAITMKAPVYYLIARIDVVGGSTGWHRSRLIESAFQHLNEWWFAGTDYTRHWMQEGMDWDQTQVDITNHYLSMGVVGGIPLVFLFIAAIATAFSFVGQYVRRDDRPAQERFVAWTLGAALFAHVATFISVSYFDQSIVFLYVTLAAMGSLKRHADVPSSAVSVEGTRAFAQVSSGRPELVRPLPRVQTVTPRLQQSRLRDRRQQ
jgi:hypothetical protein